MVKVIIGLVIILFLAIGAVRVLADSINPAPPRKRRRRKKKTNIQAIHTDKTGGYIEAAWEETLK